MLGNLWEKRGLQGGLGYLKIFVSHADIEIKNVIMARAFCEISDDDRGETSFLRSSSSWALLPTPQWSESIEVRCRAGWHVTLSVLMASSTDGISPHEEMGILVTEKFAAGKTTREKYVLYKDGEPTSNAMSVSVDFYPNHQSLLWLSTDSAEDPQLPSMLLGELARMIDGSQELLPAGMSVALAALARELATLLQDDSLLETAVVSSSTVTSINPIVDGKIKLFKASSLAKAFISKVIDPLPEKIPPSPSLGLIEKQLTIFQLTDPEISVADFLLFIKVISVWYLQHAFIAGSLIVEYKLDASELDAVRTHFQTYDSALAGEIRADEFELLLQDMEGDYLPHEAGFILSTVDADRLGIVEFPEFIRWWTTPMMTTGGGRISKD
jgi:hypothetical protein